jgi:hypothetical protein
MECIFVNRIFRVILRRIENLCICVLFYPLGTSSVGENLQKHKMVKVSLFPICDIAAEIKVLGTKVA